MPLTVKRSYFLAFFILTVPIAFRTPPAFSLIFSCYKRPLQLTARHYLVRLTLSMPLKSPSIVLIFLLATTLLGVSLSSCRKTRLSFFNFICVISGLLALANSLIIIG
ncbi:hypothetical protein AOQ84DRAFT_23295 [Glonium stellatum]|uniref:Uncharacterized protein n=1 Tax=Glonium stellatum TaxID=574774 RepID=A0A8E2F2I2_9PEZI|nr:hypothetical protein AOQ84DRAFT_23295 [Glonium stellatum]